MKKNVGKYIFGGLLIAAAVLIAGDMFDWWKFSFDLSGWWALFIIVPCIISIATSGFHVGNVAGVALGVLLLLAARDIIGWNLIWQIMIPLILLLWGLSIIFRKRIPSEAAEKEKEFEKSGKREVYTAVFSSNTPLPPENGKSFQTTSVFGSVKLDLTKVNFDSEVFLQVECVFGGLEVLIPSDVRVVSSVTEVFGGIDDHTGKSNEKTKTLYISGDAVFGGIDVKLG